LNTRIVRTCTEKARDTTLDDEKYDMRLSDCLIGNSVSDGTYQPDVTTLCNQPEAYRFGPR